MKGEGERESKGGREMERECVYNFGKHRKREQREQTFLSWLLPFGLFHISSKTSVLTERREDYLIIYLLCKLKSYFSAFVINRDYFVLLFFAFFI